MMGFSSSALLDHWPYQGAEVKWFRFLPRNWPGNNVVGDAKYEIIAVVEKSKPFSIGIKARCAPPRLILLLHPHSAALCFNLATREDPPRLYSPH